MLSVARGTTATSGAGVKLVDEAAEVGIGLPSILWVGDVHKLVSVDQSRDICARPWRNVFAIQMSSFKNLSIRRM